MRGPLRRYNEWGSAWTLFLNKHIRNIALAAFALWLSWFGYTVFMDYFKSAVEASVRMNLMVIEARTHENAMKIIKIEADQAKLKKDQEVFDKTRVSGVSRTTMFVKAYTCVDDDKRPGDPAYCVTKDGTHLTKDHYYKIVAVKPGRYPLGTWLRLTHVNGGIITTVRVADWGNVDADTLDLFIDENDRQKALQWGRQSFRVQVLE